MKPVREISLTDLRTDICRELLAYWESKKTGPYPPLRGALDPPLEKPHLIHLFFIEQVVDGGSDFRKRLAGTKIAEMLGSDPTGKRLSQVWREANMSESEVALLISTMANCVATGVPTAAEGTFEGIGKDWVEWEVIFTPLRVDGDEIKQVMGCVGWLAPDSLVEEEQALRERFASSSGRNSRQS